MMRSKLDVKRDETVVPEQSYGQIVTSRRVYERRYQLHVPGGRGKLFPKLATIADCPSIFSLTHYERHASRFLRETFVGRWGVAFGAPPNERDKAITSIIGTGDALVNFLSWSDVGDLSLTDMTYDDVLQYQDDMASGVWSAGGRPIGGSTVNQRGSVASSYLMFLNSIEARGTFVPRTTVKKIKSRKTGHTYDVTVRVGTKKTTRARTERLGLPQESWKDDWLGHVRRRRGKSKMFACRLIVDAGPRASEVCGLHVDRWPSSRAIADAERSRERSVTMLLTYTKGNVPRDIPLEVAFAKLVRKWIDNERPLLIEKFVKRTQQEPPTALFVSDAPGSEGVPVSKSRLYECFKLKVPGFSGRWYPHKGRHYFTCTYLFARLKETAVLAGKTISEMTAYWIHEQVNFHWELASEVLGHADPATTRIYARWFISIFQGFDAAERWESQVGDGGAR